VLLAFIARLPGQRLAAIYAVLACAGAARSFMGAASHSIMPALVPAERFGKAVALESTLWQGSMIAGPMVGGLASTAFRPPGPVYLIAAAPSLVAMALAVRMHRVKVPPSSEPATLRSVLAGVRYVARSPIVLGCTTLDLFAVLLGGSTALLPVYARDILHLG